jgi:hypothetical protein
MVEYEVLTLLESHYPLLHKTNPFYLFTFHYLRVLPFACYNVSLHLSNSCLPLSPSLIQNSSAFKVKELVIVVLMWIMFDKGRYID